MKKLKRNQYEKRMPLTASDDIPRTLGQIVLTLERIIENSGSARVIVLKKDLRQLLSP